MPQLWKGFNIFLCAISFLLLAYSGFHAISANQTPTLQTYTYGNQPTQKERLDNETHIGPGIAIFFTLVQALWLGINMYFSIKQSKTDGKFDADKDEKKQKKVFISIIILFIILLAHAWYRRVQNSPYEEALGTDASMYASTYAST